MNKNILNLVFGLSILLFTTTACEKDWLDVTSNTQIRAEEQFESEDGFRDALIGVYIGMTEPELYSRDMTWNIVDLLSQQYSALPSLAVYDEVQRFDYENVRATQQIDKLWSNSYNVIANINLALEFIENTDVLNPIDYSIIKGELLALRVFLHFDLIRLYGYGNLENRNLSGVFAIPYVTAFDKGVTAQLSYSDTFNLMEADLAEALNLLREDPIFPSANRPDNYYTEVNRDGFYNNRELRMNYFAAKALQARLYMWQGGDKINLASNAAREVIETGPFNLINSENYSVSSDPLLYPEVIFSLDVTAFADIVNRFTDASSGTNYDALYYAPSTAGNLFETENVNIGLADIRYNTLLTSQTRGLVSTKLRQTSGRSHPNKMPLIKLPEMYYIVAEGHLKNNQKQEAISILNIVRESRGILEEIPMELELEEVEEELTKEYRKEFLMEGQLFFYYKRNGFTSIPGLSETLVVDDAIYVLPYPDNEVEFGNR